MNMFKKLFDKLNPNFCRVDLDKVIKADPLYLKGYEAGRLAERGACVVECYRQKANSARMSEVMAIDRCVNAIQARGNK